ncbi:MAG: TraB/GumN family protein [Thermomonas sp.]|nr:TraB/GumN family protein [Thermomonas sp.]
MTHAARQRAVQTHASSSACGLLPAMLLSAAVSAGVPPQDAPSAAQASQPPQPQLQDAQTRGVSAQAATDAVASQLPPTDPVSQSSAAPQALAAGDAVPASIAPRLPVAPVLRGVLFRVTPPAATLLPAEALQAQGDSPAPPATASAGDPAPMPTPAPAAPAPMRASYLLATIHFGTPEEQGIDYAQLQQTLAEVDTFVNEANLDEAWKPELDGYRWLPEQSPLSNLVGKDGFAQARALLPNVRAQDLDRMKPWSVLALLEARGETGGDATMDARLQRMAAGAGKRVLHLETLEQQLQALDCVPAEEHSRVLDERLRASWVLRIESAQAMAWYRARNLDAWLADIDRMQGLSDEARAIEQRARRCLLEDRNARWIGQLETLFQDGPCLVAVGAVHLAGAEGLLAALRRDGYLVEAMPL